MLAWAEQIPILGNPGIDPGTSRMPSGRSTIWANSPEHISELKVVNDFTVIKEICDLHDLYYGI